MRPRPMTNRQREIFEFVEDEILHGRPPTIREIGVQFGIGNKAVSDHLEALKKKGLIEISPRVARGIMLL